MRFRKQASAALGVTALHLAPDCNFGFSAIAQTFPLGMAMWAYADKSNDGKAIELLTKEVLDLRIHFRTVGRSSADTFCVHIGVC